MSAASGTGPAEAKSGDRRSSLGKYVKRMSSVFKREKSSKIIPAVAESAPSASAAAQQQEPAAKEESSNVAIVPATSVPTEETSTKATDVNAPATATIVASRQLDRSAMQQERARALFAKYGLTFESHEWVTAPTSMPVVQRVEKSIRMRVHRSCHHCGTSYGSEKVCVQCEHKRCKRCPRYPKKKPAEQEKDNVAAEKPKRKNVLTLTTRHGTEVAYQPAKQRVRRTCHKCDTLFMPATATICEQCRHIRCTKCPREPAKLQKWPTGYPGDAEADSDSEVEKQLEKFRRTWRKPRQRVRWECEQCHSHFVHGTPQCPGCGHERCDRCTRSPIRKTRKEEQFDPEIVAAVEAKLRALRADDSLTSGPEAF